MSLATILNSRIYPRVGLDNAVFINKAFESNMQFKGNLAEHLMLYDKIVIPTNDFGIIPILINWLGYETFLETLKEDIFSFVRSKGIMVYLNRGHGINFVTLGESNKKKFLWWQDSMFGDIEKSIELQLKNSIEIKQPEIRKILSLVIPRSKELTFETEYYKKDFAKETYNDIIETPSLAQYFFNYYKIKKGERLDLLNLPGLNDNQVRVSAIAPIRDPIDLLLRIAEINLEIAISSYMGGIDLFTSQSASKLLETKFKRLGFTNKQIEGFITLLDLNNIPDIEDAIVKNIISMKDIWKFRNSNESIKFRKWLLESDFENKRELEKLFVSSIGKKNVIDRIPSKVLRFSITAVTGIVNPLLGILSSFVDSFVANKIKADYNPKLFFDNLRKITIPKV